VACADDSLVPPAARVATPDRYSRHLLHADALGRFAIVLLTWGPGQFSPVHGHHTWCSYVVLEGRLSETTYAYDAASGLARPLATEVLERGGRRFEYAGLSAVHKLGNAEDNVGLSLHIYGIDGARVGTHVNRLVPSTQH
jgi:predicted metal-dependent enzyme (double-stranded beta helix superfamily)